MVELFGQAGLADQGGGLAATHNGGRAVAGEHFGERDRALGELWELRNAEWTVPNDRPAVRERPRVRLDRLGSRVHDPPALWNGVCGYGLGSGIRVESISNDDVGWQE